MNARHEVSEGQQRVSLRDGAELLIRPIEPDDRDRLAQAYARLSPESRRRRFLSAPARLTDEDLRYLTEVDHRRHEAMGAFDPETGDLLGVARYVRVPGDPETAEVAAAVIDDWQGRGIGTQLLTALTNRARENGLRRFTAVVSVDNRPVRAKLDQLGGSSLPDGHELEYSLRVPSAEELEVLMELPAQGLPDRLRTALRRAASGQLRLLAAVWRRPF
ncbi:MAG TPA: GNAT family N-acetyltransferase [Solirubrobacteraceae bacterium]|jgi:RimJ/RimL family protein N-acetyltransferase|nr:GNAT family N-acetyltransferase [Solirubrobacteraceae bacterium]